MIAIPKSPEEWQAMTAFMRHHAGVMPSADTQCLGWVSEGKLVICVSFNGFIGKVAQIHVAFAEGWHFAPREMLREVFRYAFETAKLEMLLGVLSSANEKAMRFDAHLGFRELYRLPGMHDDGADLVLLGMKKSECRYIDIVANDEPITADAGSA